MNPADRLRGLVGVWSSWAAALRCDGEGGKAKEVQVCADDLSAMLDDFKAEPPGDLQCLWCGGLPLGAGCPCCGAAQQPPPALVWYWRGRLLGLLRSRGVETAQGDAVLVQVREAIRLTQQRAESTLQAAVKRVCRSSMGPATRHDAVDDLLARYLLAHPMKGPSSGRIVHCDLRPLSERLVPLRIVLTCERCGGSREFPQ